MVPNQSLSIAVQNKIIRYRCKDKSFHNPLNLNPTLTGGYNEGDAECQRVIEACLTHHSGNAVNPCYPFIQRTTRRECLYTAAYLAFRHRLRHRIVTKLLRTIYRQEHSFEALFFDVAIFKRYADIRHKSMTDWPGVCRVVVPDQESLCVMSYFLRYATRERLEFAGRPSAQSWYQRPGPVRRLVDLALEHQVDAQLPAVATAIRLASVEVLRVLLRHGARLDFSDEGDNSFQASSYVIRCLFREYLRDRTGFLEAVPAVHLQCLQLLLRALPRVDPLSWLNESKLTDADTRLFVDHLRSNVLPPTRCGVEPPELKHVCRCLVRRVLCDNWQLPGGIYQLGLPRSVARYVDLEVD